MYVIRCKVKEQHGNIKKNVDYAFSSWLKLSDRLFYTRNRHALITFVRPLNYAITPTGMPNNKISSTDRLKKKNYIPRTSCSVWFFCVNICCSFRISWIQFYCWSWIYKHFTVLWIIIHLHIWCAICLIFQCNLEKKGRIFFLMHCNSRKISSFLCSVPLWKCPDCKWK